MNEPPRFHWAPCGDTMLMLHFARSPSAECTRMLLQLRQELLARRLPGMMEIVPGLASLGVTFDPDTLDKQTICTVVAELLAGDNAWRTPWRQWRLPVCYEDPYGPDLAAVSAASGLTPADVLSRHAGRAYWVYLVGFSPGFPYMGEIDPALVLPRRADPRSRVPAGSVAIATNYTAIYPQATAGGWHIIGRTPVPLFDPYRAPPALLAPGDKVHFHAVSASEFHRIAAAVAEKRFVPAATEHAA